MLDSLAEVSTGVCAGAATLAAGAAALQARRAQAVRLGTLAAALGFLTVDRALDLHDRVGYGLAAALHVPRVDAWPASIVYAPLLACIAWMLWHSERLGVPARCARVGVALLGLSLLIRPVALAAVLVLGRIPDGRPRTIGVDVQVLLALSGWLLVAAAFVEAARRNGVSRRDWRADDARRRATTAVPSASSLLRFSGGGEARGRAGRDAA